LNTDSSADALGENAKTNICIFAATLSLAIFPVTGRNTNNFDYTRLNPGSEVTSEFEPAYKVVGNKIVEISTGINNEIESLNSFSSIGEILFKNARDLEPDELNAFESYLKKKHKKLKT